MFKQTVFQVRNISFFATNTARSTCRTLSHSTNGASKLKIKFIPKLSEDCRAILPISMSRYDGSPDQRERYDREITELLTFTGNALENGDIKSLDIVSSAGLQATTWGEEKATKIENYFFDKHSHVLKRQTAVYTFQDLIEHLGQSGFDSCYASVEDNSLRGSRWGDLMEESYKSTKIGGGLESSLHYQRLEYAAICAMSGVYSNILYMGNLSLAWSYMYKVFEDKELPIFTRAIIQKRNKKTQLSVSEARGKVRSTLQSIEEILTDNEFPEKERKKLINSGITYFYAYEPRQEKKAVKNDDVHIKGMILTGK